MKCKICGHRANSIGSMARHYRRKHPSSMKRHRRSRLTTRRDYREAEEVMHGRGHYCPHCGNRV